VKTVLALLVFVVGCESTVIGAGASPEPSPRTVAHPKPSPSSSSTMLPPTMPPKEEDAGVASEEPAPEPAPDPAEPAPDPAPVRCSGTPVPCSSFGWNGCEEQTGCKWDGIDCEGKAYKCESFNESHLDCVYHEGCSWTPE